MMLCSLDAIQDPIYLKLSLEIEFYNIHCVDIHLISLDIDRHNL